MELSIIHERIHEIRGKKVILDKDLAELYGVETKYLKRSVKNNLHRFPDDFMFELTSEESNSLRCKISTLKTGRGNHIKYLPFAFTEQGIAMLSSVLHSEKAIQVNIAIMRAFVLMRQYALNFQELALKIQELEKTYDKTFDDVFDVLNHLLKKDKQLEQQTKREKIGFKK
jgi:hypothetical protein